MPIRLRLISSGPWTCSRRYRSFLKRRCFLLRRIARARRTSTGTVQHIKIEIFEWTINRLVRGETVSRDEVNQQYPERASSGVMAVLGSIPLFEQVAVGEKRGLRIRNSSR